VNWLARARGSAARRGVRAVIVNLRRAAGERRGKRKIAIAAEREGVEPPSGPAGVFLAAVGDGEMIRLIGRNAQLVPVDLKPACDIFAGVDEWQGGVRRRVRDTAQGALAVRLLHRQFRTSAIMLATPLRS